MARSASDNPDDGGGEGSSSYNAYTLDDDAGYGISPNIKKRGGGGSANSHNSSIPILKQLFVGFEDDAPGSVHRAWAVTVLFMVIFFTVSISEGEYVFTIRPPPPPPLSPLLLFWSLCLMRNHVSSRLLAYCYLSSLSFLIFQHEN